MKYMLIMRSTQAAIAEYDNTDFDEILTSMGKYNEAMMNAGVLLDGEGLSDATEGAVVNFDADPPIVTDGPYGEVHELFNGFWILDVRGKADAVEWARRAPLGRGARIEVRRIHEAGDFEEYADNEYLQKEKAWRQEQASERLKRASSS